jgi:tetratricopeptide (TPR) repeat protein
MDIDQLWDYSQPQASEERFRAQLEQAAPAIRAELLTQIARAQGLQHRFDEALATLAEVEQLLTPRTARARIRYCLERGRVRNSSGDPQGAKPDFVTAWGLARIAGDDALAVDAAHMVAIVETGAAVFEWNRRALDIAERSTDARARRWQGSLHNNLGWAYHDQGAYAEALRHFEAALAFHTANGKPENIQIARWCVARVLRSLNRLNAALAIQQALLEEHTAAGTEDGYVDEELGECLLALGRADEARPHFARAHEKLSADSWLVQNESARLERLRALSA